jgi:hypothetical protein
MIMTQGSRTNSGNIISGGNSGIVASGHARITQINHGSSPGDPLEMIDRLLRQLEADASALGGEQADDVIDDVRRLGTEVHSRKLSADNILGALSRLKTAAMSSAALLATVDQIKDLVAVLLH